MGRQVTASRHEVELVGVDGATLWHAVRIGPDEWVATGPKWTRVGFFSREALISRFEEEIALSSREPYMGIGRSLRGNRGLITISIGPLNLAWINHEYLPPEKYLPLAIPEDR